LPLRRVNGRAVAVAIPLLGDLATILFKLITPRVDSDPTSVAIAGGLEDLSLIKRMYADGAELNQKSNALYYPSGMVTACKNGRLENVKWLLDQGANLESETQDPIRGEQTEKHPRSPLLLKDVRSDSIELKPVLIHDRSDHANRYSGTDSGNTP
jgi:hypothetical protein